MIQLKSTNLLDFLQKYTNFMKKNDSYKLFGTLAVEKRWVTEQQVNEAIKEQQTFEDKPLGEIFQ